MKYKIGDVVKGKIAGIQPYGAFVKLDDHTQGLIHISECKHGFVANISDILNINQEVEVMILDIDEYNKKISLSLRLLENTIVPEKELNKPKKHFWTDKKNRIGYASIAKQKDMWVKEALEKIN